MSALSTCSYYGLEKIEKKSTGVFFQDKLQSLFAAPSTRSTIGVKIGQKSHLSENFQGFARASWNDFNVQFCLHFNSPMQNFLSLSKFLEITLLCYFCYFV